MIHVVFEVTESEDVSVFSQGHITLIGDRETVSSGDNNASMMIFLSLSTLLYGIRELITTTKRSDEFEPIDTARFGFEVNKTSLGKLRILYRGRTIGEAAFEEFLPALYESASVFVAQHRSSSMMESRETALFQELEESLNAFEAAVKAYQPPIRKVPKRRRAGPGTKTSRRSRGLPAESDD